MSFSSLVIAASIFTLSVATNVDPAMHGKCVGWVNKMRAKEGLPALQHWTDFEPCADMTADRDSRKGIEYWSYGRGIFCDWAPYAPTAQLTCDRTGSGEDAIEGCLTNIWKQKDNLRLNSNGEMECNTAFATDIEQCAYGYLVLRGGHRGYNIYDRVACGLHETDDGQLWINLIFGRGEKVSPKMLKKAKNWPYAPADWDRENFQQYGFACGGDKNTHPAGMLVEDCTDSESGNLYADCTGEYDLDYRFEACGEVAPSPEPTQSPSEVPTESPTGSPTAVPTGSPTSAPTEAPTELPTEAPTESPTQSPTPSPTEAPSQVPTESPTTAPTESPTLPPTQEPTESPTLAPTQSPTSEPTLAPTITPTMEPSVPGPEQICAAVGDKNTCKGTSGCYFGENADGPCTLFTGVCEDLSNKKTCKNAEPCVIENGRCRSKNLPNPTPSPTLSNPTPSPTPSPTTPSCDIGSKGECRKTPGCTYGKKGPCAIFTLTCQDISSRSACSNTYGCGWKKSQCIDTVDISPA